MQIPQAMFAVLNTLLAQRQTIFAAAAAAGAQPTCAQLAPLVVATRDWTKAVQANIRESKKMRFHHRPVEPKDLGVRQKVGGYT
jgi:hypothetical protein